MVIGFKFDKDWQNAPENDKEEISELTRLLDMKILSVLTTVSCAIHYASFNQIIDCSAPQLATLSAPSPHRATPLPADGRCLSRLSLSASSSALSLHCFFTWTALISGVKSNDSPLLQINDSPLRSALCVSVSTQVKDLIRRSSPSASTRFDASSWVSCGRSTPSESVAHPNTLRPLRFMPEALFCFCVFLW